MKPRFFKLAGFYSASLYLTVCLTTACTQPTPSTPPDKSDQPPKDTRKYDSKRTGECDRDDDCQKICQDIFQGRKAKEACKEFSISAVEDMNQVFKVLEKPEINKLEALNFQVLELMLDISSEPLETAASRMNPTEKKRFLVWLAEDFTAARLISEADSDFKVMDRLLGTTQATIVSEVKRSIDSGDNFVEIALAFENAVALEWLHNFFGNQCDGRDYERCIFKDYYCGIYTSFSASQNTADKYFDHEFFTKALDEVLASHRPSGLGNNHW
ncbi:MAG: hypothetical protein OXB86_01595, partial [Bdellovibrionales bacterium]|nr:hypothetical protein [Bdellovibrionales bacterium]